jgi:hypothetical protein
MSLNTVAQCDIRLLQMELDWKLTRSGPFPEGIRNAIANLRAVLVIREAKASQKIPASANTATPTIYTPTTTAATTADSNNAITTVEQQDNREPGVRREEEARGVGKQDRTEEREPERGEVETGDQEGIEQSKGEVRDHALSTTASMPVNPVPCTVRLGNGHQLVDWSHP